MKPSSSAEMSGGLKCHRGLPHGSRLFKRGLCFRRLGEGYHWDQGWNREGNPCQPSEFYWGPYSDLRIISRLKCCFAVFLDTLQSLTKQWHFSVTLIYALEIKSNILCVISIQKGMGAVLHLLSVWHFVIITCFGLFQKSYGMSFKCNIKYIIMASLNE